MTLMTRTGGCVRKKNGKLDMRYRSSRQLVAFSALFANENNPIVQFMDAGVPLHVFDIKEGWVPVP